MSVNLRDNVLLMTTLLEGLKLPDGIRLVCADVPLFLQPTPGGTHRADYVVYLFKPHADNRHIWIRAVSLGFLNFATAETADGLDWALALVRKVEDAARLLEGEIERGEATVIEDGGPLPTPTRD
ncbi:MAG: hypothetical protein PVI87_10755 [Gammaproteobacteria bacterium]|jgi:hypothetical protein